MNSLLRKSQYNKQSKDRLSSTSQWLEVDHRILCDLMELGCSSYDTDYTSPPSSKQRCNSGPLLLSSGSSPPTTVMSGYSVASGTVSFSVYSLILALQNGQEMLPFSVRKARPRFNGDRRIRIGRRGGSRRWIIAIQGMSKANYFSLQHALHVLK